MKGGCWSEYGDLNPVWDTHPKQCPNGTVILFPYSRSRFFLTKLLISLFDRQRDGEILHPLDHSPLAHSGEVRELGTQSWSPCDRNSGTFRHHLGLLTLSREIGQ